MYKLFVLVLFPSRLLLYFNNQNPDTEIKIKRTALTQREYLRKSQIDVNTSSCQYVFIDVKLISGQSVSQFTSIFKFKSNLHVRLVVVSSKLCMCMCRRNVDCYCVHDQVGGELVYGRGEEQ